MSALSATADGMTATGALAVVVHSVDDANSPTGSCGDMLHQWATDGDRIRCMDMAGAQVLHRGMTWRDFLALPDDDRYRHAELINGEVVVTAATPLHQQVVGRLWAMIDGWARAGDGRGEVTLEPAVQVSDRTGYLPDVAWFPQAKCAPPGQPPAFEQPPDLVVEVLSPSTRSFDAVRKRHDYAAVGVSELWLIDPDEPAGWVLRRSEGEAQFTDVGIDLGVDDELTSPQLPGLAFRLGALVER